MVRCGAVRCGAVRCGAVRRGAVRCGAVRCGGAARCGTRLPKEVGDEHDGELGVRWPMNWPQRVRDRVERVALVARLAGTRRGWGWGEDGAGCMDGVEWEGGREAIV